MSNERISRELGIVAMVPKGTYSADAYYEKLNTVTYQGSSYVAKKSTHGNLPTNTTYWDLLASKGSTGSQGPQGPIGPKGDTGNPGASPIAVDDAALMTDTTKIYVLTTDGHWYWYDTNTTSWKDGGTYQAAEDSDTVDTLKDIIEESNLYYNIKGVQSINLVLGTYSNPNSGSITSVSYYCTAKITIENESTFGFLESGYDYKYGASDQGSYSSWSNEDLTLEAGSYTFTIRKNGVDDITTLIDHINTIFGIITLTPHLDVTDNQLEILNVANYGVDLTGTNDCTSIIQSLLNIASTKGKISLYFPNGTYKINSILRYYNYTELTLAKGATLAFNMKTGILISNGNSVSDGNNYNKGSLKIVGGTIKSALTSGDTSSHNLIGIQACQLEKLEVRNCHFIDCCSGNHLIDMSGIKEVIIDNNIFEGMHLPTAYRPTEEADYSYDDGGTTIYTDLEMLQVDHGTGLGVGTHRDPSINVNITNNVFLPNSNNTNSCIYRPIGVHSYSDLGYYKNITITGNTINNAIGRVISFFKTRNLNISKNTFNNSSESLFSDIIRLKLSLAGAYADLENVTISENEVNYTAQLNDYKFINVVGTNGTVKCKNIIITKNKASNMTIDTTECENVVNEMNNFAN